MALFLQLPQTGGRQRDRADGVLFGSSKAGTRTAAALWWTITFSKAWCRCPSGVFRPMQAWSTAILSVHQTTRPWAVPIKGVVLRHERRWLEPRRQAQSSAALEKLGPAPKEPFTRRRATPRTTCDAWAPLEERTSSERERRARGRASRAQGGNRGRRAMTSSLNRLQGADLNEEGGGTGLRWNNPGELAGDRAGDPCRG